jgi:hypothetical protein
MQVGFVELKRSYSLHIVIVPLLCNLKIAFGLYVVNVFYCVYLRSKITLSHYYLRTKKTVICFG